VLWVRAKHLIVSPGRVLENGCVLIQEGRILRVGVDLEAPAGARRLEGQVVCASFIDAWSGLGIERESREADDTSPATRAVDALDPYSGDHLREEALRAGVTIARVQTGAESAFGGLGAVVRLVPGLARDAAVILDEAVLGTSVGVSGRRRGIDVFDRVEQLDKFVDQLDAGRKYREDWLEYEKELAEWQEEIAKKEKELEGDFKKAKKDREKDLEEAKEKDKEFKEKKYKEDKKPKKPKFDADREVLARVADGLLPTIVHANRFSEIRGILDRTEDFDRLRLILAGGTWAADLADGLAARRIPVLLSPAPLGARGDGAIEGHDLGLAARLDEAGVEVLIGSGGVDGATRDLPLLAALAIGHGLDRETAFAALTLGAARALDVADRLGSLERGKDADLLVLDGEPLLGTTSVRYVVSAGRVVVSPEN
jgi:imidazolonepropionase-like amidohydrolase